MVIVLIHQKLVNMKKLIHSIIVTCGIITLFSGCKPEKIELGSALDKTALKFTVAPSANNPNDIVLKSLTPNATPYWVSPSGYSIKVTDTINIPFPGEYTIQYAAQSRGGLVYADPVKVKINSIDQNTVSGTMWVQLTGGLGKSKTWVLDLDAAGVSKYFAGPFYFGGTGWQWDPAFKDIPWANVSAGNYGTMTFDLIGDANFSSDNKMFPDLSGTGKFMLYSTTKELQTIGAQVLHDKAQGGQVANWNARMQIKILTDSTMQLIAKKDPNNWLLYNYVTKEYYDTH
jgi:hypothetical protein